MYTIILSLHGVAPMLLIFIGLTFAVASKYIKHVLNLKISRVALM